MLDAPTVKAIRSGLWADGPNERAGRQPVFRTAPEILPEPKFIGSAVAR